MFKYHSDAPISSNRVVKLGWVLLSPPTNPQPSTRIAALNVMASLGTAGYGSNILYAPTAGTERPQLPPLNELMQLVQSRDIDIVIFQKTYGESVLAFAKALRNVGIKTVFLVCDLVQAEMTQATDATVVVTPYLRSLYPQDLQGKIWVVHDGIENTELIKTHYSTQRGSANRPLDAVLVSSSAPLSLANMGYPPAWLRVGIFGRYAEQTTRFDRCKTAARSILKKRAWRQGPSVLAFATSRRIVTRPWTESAAYKALLSADIGVIPVDTSNYFVSGEFPPEWMRKSENRLTLKMSMGLPVIASPVPSYLDVINQGVNGFLADTRHEWQHCLTALRDPDLRLSMGRHARATVALRYSIAQQAAALVRILGSLTNHSKS
jgi:glycosyltransferase involved in cell wall biosynthesis